MCKIRSFAALRARHPHWPIIFIFALIVACLAVWTALYGHPAQDMSASGLSAPAVVR